MLHHKYYFWTPRAEDHTWGAGADWCAAFPRMWPCGPHGWLLNTNTFRGGMRGEQDSQLTIQPPL